MMKKSTLAEARKVSTDTSTGQLYLGQLLMSIRDEGWFHPLHPTMRNYAWNELGLTKTTCYALIQVARTAKRLHIRDARVRRIGWSKFAMISPYLTRDNCQELTELAEHFPRAVLERKLRGPLNGTNKTFHGLDQASLDALDRAIGDAKALGATTEAEALVAICETFSKAL